MLASKTSFPGMANRVEQKYTKVISIKFIVDWAILYVATMSRVIGILKRKLDPRFWKVLTDYSKVLKPKMSLQNTKVKRVLVKAF